MKEKLIVVVAIVIAIALLLSSLFFFLGEIGLALEYDMTYKELVAERGIMAEAALWCRYVLAYPLTGILILVAVFTD